ncbi:cell wall glucanase [Phyllosticta citricarpa]|uniref:Cell wall glucanase n=2 Tax=Phyllosticta TaxID=121621 RepID=A0ABR1LBJ6_9PEZI
MKTPWSTGAGGALASAVLLLPSAFAQENPALGRSVQIDFSSASDSFTSQGPVSYGSGGASFTIQKSGDSPMITSKWYIMFGKVEFVLKAAPGKGIVSSAVLQSDVKDEIDFEWLGSSADEVQTNYFGKGQTTSYKRGAFHADPGSQSEFKTYTIDWTADELVWQVNGVTVRALKPQDANGQYPQTPCHVKIGAWPGGDPSLNEAGTVEWARGPTDYSQAPFTLQLKSVSVTDYSTGTQYKYGGDGTWQTIIAVGGSVNPKGGTGVKNSAPAITSTSNGQPMPWSGSNDDSASLVTRSGYPWVPESKTMSSASTLPATDYPGLPAGWTVTSSGKVVPPNSASVLDIPTGWIYLVVAGISTGFLLVWRL